jgi:hypothetical protein
LIPLHVQDIWGKEEEEKRVGFHTLTSHSLWFFSCYIPEIIIEYSGFHKIYLNVYFVFAVFFSANLVLKCCLCGLSHGLFQKHAFPYIFCILMHKKDTERQIKQNYSQEDVVLKRCYLKIGRVRIIGGQ